MNGRDDRGVATVWSMALVYLLLVAALSIGAVAALVTARMKAATVADLAAVAAVQSLACDAAGTVAQANGLTLLGCRAEGEDVIVQVQAPAPDALVRIADWLGQVPPVITVAARAGPG